MLWIMRCRNILIGDVKYMWVMEEDVQPASKTARIDVISLTVSARRFVAKHMARQTLAGSPLTQKDHTNRNRHHQKVLITKKASQS